MHTMLTPMVEKVGVLCTYGIYEAIAVGILGRYCHSCNKQLCCPRTPIQLQDYIYKLNIYPNNTLDLYSLLNDVPWLIFRLNVGYKSEIKTLS